MRSNSRSIMQYMAILAPSIHNYFVHVLDHLYRRSTARCPWKWAYGARQRLDAHQTSRDKVAGEIEPKYIPPEGPLPRRGYGALKRRNQISECRFRYLWRDRERGR